MANTTLINRTYYLRSGAADGSAYVAILREVFEFFESLRHSAGELAQTLFNATSNRRSLHLEAVGHCVDILARYDVGDFASALEWHRDRGVTIITPSGTRIKVDATFGVCVEFGDAGSVVRAGHVRDVMTRVLGHSPIEAVFDEDGPTEIIR